MRILKSKVMYVAVLFSLLLLIGLVPVGYEAKATSQRRVTLRGSYLRCCQSLTDAAVKRELLATVGIVTDDSEKTEQPTLEGKGWFSGSSMASFLSGNYDSSEDFDVRCETDVGWVELAMRQDTKFTTSELQVVTYSLQPGDKVKRYQHSLRLMADKNAVEATVELEICIQLSVPWLFRSIADDRLATSIALQTENFAEKLSQSINQ